MADAETRGTLVILPHPPRPLADLEAYSLQTFLWRRSARANCRAIRSPLTRSVVHFWRAHPGHFWRASKNAERRDRLLLVSALAMALLTLLGAAGEAIGIDRHWKVNTSKKRQHSLFRQGCNYYSALPKMREEWLRPLLNKFAELLRAQPVFRDALGLI